MIISKNRTPLEVLAIAEEYLAARGLPTPYALDAHRDSLTFHFDEDGADLHEIAWTPERMNDRRYYSGRDAFKGIAVTLFSKDKSPAAAA